MDQGDVLQNIHDNDEGTNRPPHREITMLSANRSTSSWSQNLKHDVTVDDITEIGNLNTIRASLQQAASITSQESTPNSSNPPHRHHHHHTATTEVSPSTPRRDSENAVAGPSQTSEARERLTSFSTTPSSFQSGIRLGNSNKRNHQGELVGSPPRTIPFAISPRSLINTPTREAARIMADNTFQAAGFRSSDDDDDNSMELAHKRSKEKGKQPVDHSWDASNIMEIEDIESRARFDNFLKARQNNRVEEFPSWAGSAKSPSNRTMRHQTPLASTPTTHRVLNQKLMKIPLPADSTLENIQSLQEESMSSLHLQSPGEFILPSTPYLQDTEERDDQENIGAYEFSDLLMKKDNNRDRFSAHQARENQSPLTEEMTFGSGSDITMVSGYTGLIPARFDLKYFPSKFRTPPGSTQLSRVYNFFAERPGEMLTIQDFLRYADSSEYNDTKVYILIDVLVAKKFLKRVGDKQAWTIRR